MLSWMRERVGKSKDFKQLGCTAKGVDKFLTQTGITVGGRKTQTEETSTRAKLCLNLGA
ncbi:hypothetical protein KC19_1G022100 [Ceratodon purpureus]|uniref:Uncharacterized protein n=1 Tax=Ceratodon purpureus TaxID=3225 RepID=A0A8T0J3X5_CERPU|nr:hypothetical protein KC19_1G022100 [Ceratodon purpureus]